FKIEHHVWGVVTNNASKDAILHQAITLPFCVQHAQLEAAACAGGDDESDRKEIKDLPLEEANAKDNETAPSSMLDSIGDEGDEELPNIQLGSAEDDKYHQVMKALWKAAREA
ncbi:hypothetical protein FRC10_007119, partial [Ceratobasidium sp. 414]